jgi:hypothetical protein
MWQDATQNRHQVTVYTSIRRDYQSQLLLSANKQKFEAVKIMNFRNFLNFRFFDGFFFCCRHLDYVLFVQQIYLKFSVKMAIKTL